MSYLSPAPKSYSSNPYSSPSRYEDLTQMKGYLYAKQGVSMIWKQYYVQTNNSVFIAFEEKEEVPAFTLNLNQYQVSWHGRLQEKYSFVLKNKADSIRDIRWLYVGADSEIVARNWYHYLLNTMDRSNLQINGGEGPLGDVPIQVEYTEGWETKRRSEEKSIKGSFEARTLRELEKSKTPPRYSVETESMRSPEKSNHYSYSPFRSQMNGNGTPHPEMNGEFALPDEAPEWVEKLFKEHIQNDEMWKNGQLNQSKWQKAEDASNKMMIWVSKEDVRKLRGKFIFTKTSVQKVVKILLDLDKKKEWEDSIISTKTLFYAPTTKQAVIHETYKAEGFIQRKREFLYTRYLFQSQNAYFIIEKTLGNEASKGLSKLLNFSSQGKVDYSIMQISEKDRNTELNILLKLTNGGLLTPGQDSKLSLTYLQNMANIESVLAAIWDLDTLDLMLIPCPENEMNTRTQIVETEQYGRNSFNPEEDRYWRERSIQGEKEKVRSYKIEKVEDIPQTKMASRYREPLDLDNGIPSEEENLRDEDINEKILNIARPSYRKKNNVLEIDLSIEDNSKFEERVSKRNEPDYDESYIPIPYDDNMESLKVLLERSKKGDHILECINKRIKTKELTRSQKDARIPDTNGDFMCGYSWKRDPNGGLEFIDKDIIDRQRQVVMWLLRSAGRMIMEGKSLVNMSLPIIISGKETTLHRAAMNCAYAPVYLPTAGDQRDPLEAFKWVLTYFFTSHHVGINQEKPFNPILGETYQGFLGGIPIDCEQISHHPPISSVYMKTDKFVVQSNFRLEVVLGGPNSAKGLLLGNICIRLPKSDSQVYGLYPPAISSGTTMGKRLFYYVDKLRAYDPKHNFYAEIVFNPDDKGTVGNLFSRQTVEVDKATGTIYQLKPEAMKEFSDKKPKGDTKWNFNPKEHSIQELAKIEGKWTKFFKIDGKTFWKDEDVRPCLLIDKPNKPLPSDCRFREDLIYRKMGDFEKGQVAKEKMEDLQRKDKKSRHSTRDDKNHH